MSRIYGERFAEVWNHTGKACILYQKGLSLEIVANFCKCDVATLKEVLRENGIDIRKGGGSSKGDIKRKDVWQDEDEIVDLYLSGVSLRELAKEFECDRGLIKRILHKHDIEIERMPKLNRLAWSKSNEICDDYQNGLEVKKIIRKYNTSYGHLYRVLRVNNIIFRTEKELIHE